MNKLVKNFLLYLSLGIFGFFLCSRIFFFKSGFLEKSSATISYPFILVCSKISSPIKKYLTKRKNSKNLSKTIEQLKENNETLLAENIQLKATLNYKNLSSDLLNFQKRYNLQSGIVAKILIKNFDTSQHYFWINKGEKDGVKKDMAAIYKFQLVGRTTEVYNHISKVLLISDSNCKIAAFTNENNAKGIVRGTNKKNFCELAYVSHLFKIQKGDFVLSSGKGLIFPEGFCLGKITNYETKEKSYLLKY